MTLETEEAAYDQDVAKSVLDALGEERVFRAHSHMQERNMLTRVVSDPEKRAPGRQWKFQEWYVPKVPAAQSPEAREFTDTLVGRKRLSAVPSTPRYTSEPERWKRAGQPIQRSRNLRSCHI